MSAIPSSDDAVDGYRHLEEYIFKSDRDHDREIRTTIRLWNWQTAQIRVIRNKIGTNFTEVVLRAFSMGLKNLRNRMGDTIEGLSELSARSTYFVQNTLDVPEARSRFDEKVNNAEFDLSSNADWKLSEPRGVAFKDSELSEVNDSFIDDLFFGPWIKRVIIGFGLSESKLATETTKDSCNNLANDINRIAEGSRDLVESSIKSFVTSNYPIWESEGIRRKKYNDLIGVKNMMVTEHRETVEYVVEQLEDKV